MRYEVGDAVYAPWGFGTEPAKVIGVKRTLFGLRYFVEFSKLSKETKLLSGADLLMKETVEDAKERLRKERRMDNEDTRERLAGRMRAEFDRHSTRETLVRGDWFNVEAKMASTFLRGTRYVAVARGDVTSMRALSNGRFEVRVEGFVIEINGEQASSQFKRLGTKEEKQVGAELYGYPEEDDVPSTKHSVLAESEYEARIAELKRQLEEARREKVAEEYGIVTERYLWSALINVPPAWAGSMFQRYNEHTVEVLTSERSMVEAAMAAEAMAKEMNEDAKVINIEYQRKLNAIK